MPFTELACLDLLQLPKHCEDICCLPLNACDALMPEGCLQEVEDILDTVWNVVKDESGAGEQEATLSRGIPNSREC